MTSWTISTTKTFFERIRKTRPRLRIILQLLQHRAAMVPIRRKGVARRAIRSPENDANLSSNLFLVHSSRVRLSPSKESKLSTMLDQLDREIDRYARREGSTFLRCLVCSRTFPTTPTLMLHLELSYPAFHFQLHPDRLNVIEVAFRNAYQSQISSKISKISHSDYIPGSTTLSYK